MFIIIYLNHFLLDMMSMGKNMVKELLGAFPGIDEAMSFAEVMRYVKHSKFLLLRFCLKLVQVMSFSFTLQQHTKNLPCKRRCLI